MEKISKHLTKGLTILSRCRPLSDAYILKSKRQHYYILHFARRREFRCTKYIVVAQISAQQKLRHAESVAQISWRKTLRDQVFSLVAQSHFAQRKNIGRAESVVQRSWRKTLRDQVFSLVAQSHFARRKTLVAQSLKIFFKK